MHALRNPVKGKRQVLQQLRRAHRVERRRCSVRHDRRAGRRAARARAGYSRSAAVRCSRVAAHARADDVSEAERSRAGFRGTAYVVWAILLTLLFFPPTGVVAVAYASKIRMLVDAGRYEEAGRAKKNALAWSIVTAVLGVLGGIIWLVKRLWALHVI